MTELATFLNTGIPLKSLLHIKKHERMIEILEDITKLERRKRNALDFASTINREYYQNRADAIQNEIDRLYLIYYRVLRGTAGVEREEGE